MSIQTLKPFDNPAEEAAHLLVRIGLALMAIAVPVSAVGSRRAVFTLLPVGAGLILLAAALGPNPRHGLRDLRHVVLSPAGLSALFLGGWAGLSLVWTPFLHDAAERFFKVVGSGILVTAAIAFLPERTRTANLYLFPIGVGVAALATFGAAISGSSFLASITDADLTLERAVITLVILVWPALGALAVRDRWTSASWLAVVVTAATITAWTPIAVAALAIGALVFALSTSAPARVALVLGLLFAGLFVCAPLLPLAAQVVARPLATPLAAAPAPIGDLMAGLDVWAALVRNEAVRLVTGHGLDTATRGVNAGYLPAATPKSILFEVWYEFGVIGAVASAVLTARAFVAVGRGTAAVSPFLLAGVVSALAIAIFGLSTAQLWWVSVLCVAAVAFAIVIRGQYRTDRPPVRMVEPPPLATR